MRDSTNHDEADERDGPESPSANQPQEDDLRAIMSGRPIQRPQPIETGQYSAEAKSDAEPAWSDVVSDSADTADPPWHGQSPQIEEPTVDREYQRPPFYADTKDADDERHPQALSRFGPPAGFGRRFVAYLIDYAVTIVILALLFPLLLDVPLVDLDAIPVENEAVTNGGSNVPAVTPKTQQNDEQTQIDGDEIALVDILPWYGTFTGTILFLALPIIYNTILIGIWGTTLGKRILNVYVLDKGGNIPGIPIAFVRAVATVVSANVLYIGHLFILRTDHRTLHDHLVGTYVINLTSEERPAARGHESVD